MGGGGNKASASLQYKGTINQLEVPTFASSLLSFAYALQELNRELNPSIPLTIYVKGTKQGSFIAELNLVLDTFQKIKALFGHSPFPLEDILVFFILLLQIKISLKGNPPEKVEKENGKVVIQINGNNNQIVIPGNLFDIASQNAKLDKHIKDFADTLEENPNISGIQIETPKKTLEIPREYFPFLQKPNPLLKKQEKEKLFKNQIVSPIKIVFSPNRKWEFLWNGEKISALITDEEFFQKIDDFNFTTDTKMIVDLKVLQIYDPETEQWINEDYFVVKVHEVLNRFQRKLF